MHSKGFNSFSSQSEEETLSRHAFPRLDFSNAPICSTHPTICFDLISRDFYFQTMKFDFRSKESFKSLRVLFPINLPTENYNQLVAKNRLPKMPSENVGRNRGQKQGANSRYLVPTGIPEPEHDRGEIFGVNCLESHTPHQPPIGLTGYVAHRASISA
jgi:hypothetical protein